MSDRKTDVQAVPDPREALTGSGGIEERSRNSAEVSTATPGQDYAPPPVSLDSQQPDGD